MNMSIIYILIVMMIVLIGGYIINRMHRKKALLLLQNTNLKVTSQAFFDSVEAVSTAHFDGKRAQKFKEPALIADVWGKGVMAFEYMFDTPELTVKELADIKEQLTASLAIYAKKNHLAHLEGCKTFVVSDIWLFAGVLHIDISYVVNDATKNYLHDIKAANE